MGHARFYTPGLTPGSNHVELPEDESRHVTRVMRLGVGREVLVFDGRGGEWLARIDRAGRGRVRVRLVEAARPAREPAVAVTLVQAVLKGDHMDEVVRDAVMMGVTAIQPVVSARSLVKLASLERGQAVERWRRVAIASVKQCGRAVVPTVHDPVSVEAYLERHPGAVTVRLILVEPAAAGASPQTPRGLAGSPRPAAAQILIGPEGGWTPTEVLAATAHGHTPVTVGTRTIRADAMSTVALAVLQFVWGDL